ncbi:carbamoyltransferase family protein [Rubrivivax gelatinosus]|uniref:carbamoyltransferase family protein n=1 Tax=Rubrivivax gelatinosus TaxID=28068 RepID=UPI0002DE0464|nr:carbamoyltransferase C-terminal domain-containing protein [Rubrivivax gelatinosus]MBG6082447.1 carbamoyltransferase [Rubrivivax gelatinosus]
MHTKHDNLIVGYGNNFHDPSVALIWGEEIFAEALERSSQTKRGIGSPLLTYAARPVAAHLRRLGLSQGSLREVTLRSSWMFRKRDLAMAAGAMLVQPRFARRILTGESAQLWTMRGLKLFQIQLEGLLQDEAFLVPRAAAPVRVERTQHHLTHAATAAYTSPFDECVVMVVDGTGEMHSSSFFHFTGGRLRKLSCTSTRHSVGLLYARVTELCGFSALWGEEWKVMGLAAYGERDERVYRFFADRTRVDGLQVRLDFPTGCFKAIEPLCGGFRRKGDPDIMRAAVLARSFQQYFTDIILQLAANLAKLGLSRNLAYAGGCALNSAANGQILAHTGFERLHVPCAPADDGNALGAALFERHAVRGVRRTPCVASPYLGSAIDDATAREQLHNSGYAVRECPDEAGLAAHVAGLLCEGRIVAWVQGRAEFGPRALGNRSILADPRTEQMRDRVNRLIKRREDYRPLAPSVLHEFASDYFEDCQDSPYMERTLRVKKLHAPRVAGVVHVDGTARLQTVTRDANPLYHRLISAFHERTGVPMLLNTSLNVMGKPIVHSMEDALAVFAGTQIDVLVVNRFVATKPSMADDFRLRAGAEHELPCPARELTAR